MKSLIIDKDAVHAVVTLLLEAESAVDDDTNPNANAATTSAIRVVDSFLLPKLRYDPIKKRFYQYVLIYNLNPFLIQLLE